MFAREVGGFQTAEAQGSLLTRQVSITTITGVAVCASVEIQFAVTGLIAGDLPIAVTPATATQTSGIVVLPGRRCATAGDLNLLVANYTAATVAPLAGLYDVTIYRR